MELALLRKRAAALLLVALVATSASLIALGLQAGRGGGCWTLQGVTGAHLSTSGFGAITKFALPKPTRGPNSVVVATDGSVWFGEEAVPGVAHFFPRNGTLLEYPFPGSYEPSAGSGYNCSIKTSIWGLALWRGQVWATDSVMNRIVGLDPATGSFTSVPLAGNDSFPYALSPEGDALWVSQIQSDQLGELSANGTLTEHLLFASAEGNGPAGLELPFNTAQVAFANGTRGYLAKLSSVVTGPAIYSFNPEAFALSPVPGQGNETLYSPDSISLGGGGAWITEHGASDVDFFNMTDQKWTTYPTTWVNYSAITLPYFVEAKGGAVWFNEHYGNRMAVLDPRENSLTEFSLADPPVGRLVDIDGATTFCLGGGAAWFAETTTNDIGLVNASYVPSFSVSPSSRLIEARAGAATNVTLAVNGISKGPLTLAFSDSESVSSEPLKIRFSANITSIAALNGTARALVNIRVPAGAVGTYTLLLSATDGLIHQGTYVFLRVEQ